VDWTVETFMQECPGGASMAYPLVSTRWSQSHHIDSQHRTTITTQGVSVFRIDLLASIAKQADYFRDRCIPGTPNRYQRVDVNVTINPVGDTLTWSVVDQQPFHYLGDVPANNFGVMKFDANISEISVSASVGERQIPTGMIVAAFDITAIGAVESSRADMLTFCAKMAVSCLQLKAKPVNFDKDPIIKNVAIRDVITDRHISLRVEVFMPPNPNPAGGAGPLQTQLLGVDVIPGIANDDKAPQMPNGANTRGQQLELLLTQAFQSPCADVSLPSAVGTASASNNANYLQGGDSSVNIRTGNILPAAPTKYNGPIIRKGPYSEYRVDIRTHRHHHKLKLPSTLPIPTALPPGYQPGGPGSTFGGSGGARPKAANVTVAAPTSTVVVTWTAERWGARPVLPAPVMNDDNYSILDEVVDRASVEYHNDGQTPIYRISGEYRYLHASPEGAGDSLAMGSLPWTTDSFLDNVVQDTDYRHGIIDIGTTGDIA